MKEFDPTRAVQVEDADVEADLTSSITMLENMAKRIKDIRANLTTTLAKELEVQMKAIKEDIDAFTAKLEKTTGERLDSINSKLDSQKEEVGKTLESLSKEVKLATDMAKRVTGKQDRLDKVVASLDQKPVLEALAAIKADLAADEGEDEGEEKPDLTPAILAAIQEMKSAPKPKGKRWKFKVQRDIYNRIQDIMAEEDEEADNG